MGRGTTELKTAPKKKKLYGNDSFYLRPMHVTTVKEESFYAFYLRPSKENGFKYQLMGEFGIGAIDLVKQDIKAGDYQNIAYKCFKEDEQGCDSKVWSKILDWAVDGVL